MYSHKAGKIPAAANIPYSLQSYPHLTTSAFPWKSTELLVFKRHYSVLQSAIQSPGTLAGILYANGIIDEDVRDRAQLPSITGSKSNQILLNAVEQAIKTEPQNFHKFLDILTDEPTTELLSSRLLECYSELHYSVWAGQKHSLWYIFMKAMQSCNLCGL